ncbi:MAG: class I SAM-dependent methyltransferase [Acidobacteriota bacterium]
MESGKTLEQELADEIRAAVAKAVPATLPETEPEAGAPDPLRRAEQHLTPSVPEGARLFGLKRTLLRGFRFLWRDQAAFNTLTLEAFLRLQRDWEGRLARLREAADRESADWRRRTAVQDARLAVLEGVAGRGPAISAPSAPMPEEEIPAGVYSLFEERFRGAPAVVAEGQRAYLVFLRGLPGPVLDVGCGRGEFLALLREEGIAASGIESSPVCVRLCREAGLDVEEGSAPELVERKPKESLGAVVAFQVVEHWPAGRIFSFLARARRALRPGGVLIAETINTDSLSALRAFFLDPTHVRPVPAAALSFLAEAAGFVDTRIEYRAALPPGERLVEATENDAKLNRLLFGPQDYALIARAPRAVGD